MEHRLASGALFPILAAFRWMVVEDSISGDYRWRGCYDDVIELWNKVGVELLTMVKDTSEEVGRKPNAIGNSRTLWGNLLARVALRQLMEREASVAR